MTGITVLVRAIVVLSLFLSTISFPAYGAGRTNLTSTNSLLNGKGIPSSKLGINGDFYIDVNTFNIYGPKRNNKWPSAVSLRGPAGANGLDGKQGDKGGALSGSPGAKGEKGDAGARGPQGEKGEKGDKGDKGVTGEKGATGERGLTGVTGATGSVGATGAVGVKGETGAQGLTGAKGETGTQGLTGTTGSVGATGAAGAKGDKGDKGEKGDKGDTGTIGSQGPKGDDGEAGSTSAQAGSLVFSGSLQGNIGASIETQNFGNLLPGKKYIYDLIIWGKTASDSVVLNLSITSSGATPTIITHWNSSRKLTFRNNSYSDEVGFVAKVIVDGTNASNNYQLVATIVTGGGISAGEALTFSGGFVGLEVN
jgi:hypothetical protein